ncbi:MAG: hypothetical protein ACD_54C00134G0001, partial [uncultured bacterium]
MRRIDAAFQLAKPEALRFGQHVLRNRIARQFTIEKHFHFQRTRQGRLEFRIVATIGIGHIRPRRDQPVIGRHPVMRVQLRRSAPHDLRGFRVRPDHRDLATRQRQHPVILQQNR